jgi:hypothetical protein
MERSAIIRAKPEELEWLVTKFTGSSGGGQWSFQLQCKLCRDLGTVSAKRHTIGKPKALAKAAEKFAAQGWRLDGNQAICPSCFKKPA